jgi:hypothetical protein
VLILLFLGFSAGLPLALSGSTLLVWMREAGIDLGVIGLFALVGTPYTIKFLWAPVVDALDVPLLCKLFGRRRGWLLLSQLFLMIAIALLGLCNPGLAHWYVVFGAAVLVATAMVGHNAAMLTLAIITENFTSAIGTVIFVAYLSALCANPLHTATQYALLTALAAVGRTYLSSGAGYIAEFSGWPWFFVICALAALPSLVLLGWLQRRGHFGTLATNYTAQ